MRIYSMTATFGKLEHETLTLKPGLNIITAPNEWGKSTWCAFLAAMLYGLETRTKSTKTTLADKERYVPWSGSPMAGRIDLNWNGRDITIERSTKRRVPLGEFRAYETESGIPVPELTAANCGQMLLGVEQSVFRRAGFIRQTELPVTQDEALRRRLNALVTTGDETGSADKLADSLKDLKNRCRYNRSGLLPQAEQERDALEDKLGELNELETQSEKLGEQLEQTKDLLAQLYNHQQALAYDQARTAASQASQAEKTLAVAGEEVRRAEAACAGLPDRDQAEQSLGELRSFRDQWNSVQAEIRSLPLPPEAPQQEEPFNGMTAEAAREMAVEDAKRFVRLGKSKTSLILLAMGALGLVSGTVLLVLQVYLFGAVAGVTALLALAWGVYEHLSTQKQRESLIKKYGSSDISQWAQSIRDFDQQSRQYAQAMDAYNQSRGDVEMRVMLLRRRKEALCGDREPDLVADYWQQVMAHWENLNNARRELDRARSHYETIRAMVRPAEKPQMADHLTCTEAETARQLAECAAEQQRLQNRLGQHQGRMAILGDKGKLQNELDRVSRRIAALEQTYAALTIAQETLEDARTELQRRFAPRITKRAQGYLAAMTEGRYHSLTMGVDFSLQAGAGQEDTLHDAIWRSDGTMDQLYLALRLAVAQELTPQAPVVLDDALVRFDDQRMTAAVKLLREMAEEKQVICFTCQGREKALLEE